MTPPTPYNQLIGRLHEVANLIHSIHLLQWDEEVTMPRGGATARAHSNAHLATLVHERVTDPEFIGWLEKVEAEKESLTEEQQVIIREVRRDVDLQQKLPTEFVGRLAQACSEAFAVWQIAKSSSDFSLFQPHLEKIVALKQEEAGYRGFTGSAYDPLLDSFEPGLSTAQLDPIFTELKVALTNLINEIPQQGKESFPQKENIPIGLQEEFCQKIATQLGFSFENGRLDQSSHPFTTSLHPQDVRITSRYREDDINYCLGSLIHEVGHGLYEQGLPAEKYGTPLAEAASLAIHESQSRFFENMVGKSLSYWHYLALQLQAEFPEAFANITAEQMHHAATQVQPSLIRTESDEVTYNLHIVLRYELERDLIEGTLAVADLPHMWRQKMHQYLGVDVPDDQHGVLQDVHWSMGSFGYFPTYTLGNLYAAQLLVAVKESLPNFQALLEAGDTTSILHFMRHTIHQYGRRYSAAQLIQRISGQPLTVAPFLDYIRNKYCS